MSKRGATGELERGYVLAARSGDRTAIRALVRCYQGRVFRLACRAAGNDAAEDVTQEAFIRVLRSLPRFDPKGAAKLSTWVLGIAARTAIDHHRRRRTRTNHLTALPEPLDPEQPDVSLARAEIGARVAAAVGTLRPDIRATFVLRAYHEMTMPEIAEALDIDLGTVKSRLSRARAALRDRLGDVWNAYAKGAVHVAG